MPTIVTRSGKGAPLTNTELDANFTNLNTYVDASARPAIRPSLLLDFANSKTLDPRITFSRASSATRTNSQGLIESVPAGVPRFDHDPITLACKGLFIEEQRTNLITYSEQFDNAVWAKGSATVIPKAAIAPDGTTTADKLVEDTANAQHSIRSLTITTAQPYTMSVYAKAGGRNWIVLYSDGAVVGKIFDLANGVVGNDYGGSPTAASIVSVGGGWYRCAITFTSTAAGINNWVFTRSSGTGGNAYTGDGVSGIYIWGAQLEAGSFPTSYIPSTDTFTSRASTATFIGSNGLIQTAAANVARYQYNPNNLSIAPKLLLEGASTNLLLNSLIDGTSLATQSVSVTGQSYTLSFYGTGTVTLSGASTATVVGSGVYPSRTTRVFTPSAGTLTLTVTGTVQYAQLEAGSYPTSYIPTTSAQVTRAADVSSSAQTTRAADNCVIMLSPWFSRSEGTFFVDFTGGRESTQNGYGRALSFGTFDAIIGREGNSGVGSWDGATSLVSGGSDPAVTPAKVALSFNATQRSLSHNGGLVTGAHNGMFLGISTLAVGKQQYADQRLLNGHISRLAYYPKRVTNAELQALTA